MMMLNKMKLTVNGQVKQKINQQGAIIAIIMEEDMTGEITKMTEVVAEETLAIEEDMIIETMAEIFKKETILETETMEETIKKEMIMEIETMVEIIKKEMIMEIQEIIKKEMTMIIERGDGIREEKEKEMVIGIIITTTTEMIKIEDIILVIIKAEIPKVMSKEMIEKTDIMMDITEATIEIIQKREVSKIKTRIIEKTEITIMTEMIGTEEKGTTIEAEVEKEIKNLIGNTEDMTDFK